MKKALIMYSHGIGDTIMLTPHLRFLYNNGYIVDLMCRNPIINSHLLDNCPYVGELIEVSGIWVSEDIRKCVQQAKENMEYFYSLRDKYQWSGAAFHGMTSSKINLNAHKIDITSAELQLPITDRRLEVFISEKAEHIAKEYRLSNFPDGYTHLHTIIGSHPIHSWNVEEEYILSGLPILNTGFGGDHFMKFEDINISFVLSREAKYRILSSSVFVHACDAMRSRIDVLNYGNKDKRNWPLDLSNILNIRVCGKWVKLST